MILEGIVTTEDPRGLVNIAPMGPEFERGQDHFLLKPFRTAHTYANLVQHPEGVLHVTDDVLLFARAAIGAMEPRPALMPATRVRGRVLADACRAYEFRIVEVDDTQDRVRMRAAIVHTWRQRDFFGFNRAKHAVIEAAILATRAHLISPAEIASEYKRLEPLVRKTGGREEEQAFEMLSQYVQQQKAADPRADVRAHQAWPT
jgi:hypothetical protein